MSFGKRRKHYDSPHASPSQDVETLSHNLDPKATSKEHTKPNDDQLHEDPEHREPCKPWGTEGRGRSSQICQEKRMKNRLLKNEQIFYKLHLSKNNPNYQIDWRAWRRL